jgi:hypothetical protein
MLKYGLGSDLLSISTLLSKPLCSPRPLQTLCYTNLPTPTAESWTPSADSLQEAWAKIIFSDAPLLSTAQNYMLLKALEIYAQKSRLNSSLGKWTLQSEWSIETSKRPPNRSCNLTRFFGQDMSGGVIHGGENYRGPADHLILWQSLGTNSTR